MGKNVGTKLLALLMALALVVTAVPAGDITAQAAVKPGAVSKVKVSKITKDSAKVTYKKAKKAKGYQIRVYKGKKQVLSKKTKALSYKIKKLKANTKYTVKVRAYNGKKYGKERSVSFKTKKNTSKKPAPTPEDPTPEPPAPTPEPPAPGTTSSEGEQLVAEYNAYVAAIASDWIKGETLLRTEWLYESSGMFRSWHYSDAYTDKYQAYKHGCGTLEAITDYYADVLTTCGLTVNVSVRDVKVDYDRYNQLYAYDSNRNLYYDSRIHKGLLVTTQDGKTFLVVIVPYPNPNGLNASIVDPAGFVDGRTIVGTCPGCGNEIRNWDVLTGWQKNYSYKIIRCETCKKNYSMTNPYYNTDLSQPIYIRTATSINCMVCGLNAEIGSGNHSPVECPKCGGFLCHSCYMNVGLQNHECNP